MTIHVERAGDGDPVLLLLHGLGATGRVWQGLVEELGDSWSGSLAVPDLPGHGRSDPLPRYSFGGLACAMAGELEPGRRHIVLGHSLGGVVGLALASGWFGVDVSAVCGLGIKIGWSPQELAKAAEVAARPNRVFDSREAAAERALRVAGLTDLVAPDSALVESGLREVDGGWQLALDPPAFTVGAPDMPGLLSACRAAVVLAAGEHDPMSPRDQLLDLHPEAVTLAGLGHNAHVEDPAALLPILELLRG